MRLGKIKYLRFSLQYQIAQPARRDGVVFDKLNLNFLN